MKEYIVVQGESSTVLMEHVNLKLNEGWELQGGLAVFHGAVDAYDNCATQQKTVFYQALSREKSS